MTSPAAQAQEALRALRDTATVEGRTISGYFYLGESPQDQGYRVKLTLRVTHDAQLKRYVAELDVTETRTERGQYGYRHGVEMPRALLGQVPASRMSASRLEQLFTKALADLKADPAPLIKLLEAEEQRQ